MYQGEREAPVDHRSSIIIWDFVEKSLGHHGAKCCATVHRVRGEWNTGCS